MKNETRKELIYLFFVCVVFFSNSLGSGVSELHGKWVIRFGNVFLFVCIRLRHSGVVASWKGAAALHNPRVRLSSSSYVFIFVYLRIRPPTSSSSSVFICLCGGATVVCTLTVCAVFQAVRVKAFVVLWCLSITKSFSRVFPHVKFNHFLNIFHRRLNSSVVVLNSLKSS